MKDFKNISEVNIGDLVYDTYNEFGKKDFEFINGQSFDESKCLCKIINKTHDSVCVEVNKHPLRMYIHDGGRISNPLTHTQWYKFKREHEYEIGFPFRFKRFES